MLQITIASAAGRLHPSSRRRHSSAGLRVYRLAVHDPSAGRGREADTDGQCTRHYLHYAALGGRRQDTKAEIRTVERSRRRWFAVRAALRGSLHVMGAIVSPALRREKLPVCSKAGVWRVQKTANSGTARPAPSPRLPARRPDQATLPGCAASTPCPLTDLHPTIWEPDRLASGPAAHVRPSQWGSRELTISVRQRKRLSVSQSVGLDSAPECVCTVSHRLYCCCVGRIWPLQHVCPCFSPCLQELGPRRQWFRFARFPECLTNAMTRMHRSLPSTRSVPAVLAAKDGPRCRTLTRRLEVPRLRLLPRPAR